jgi:hypothetical protein
MAAVGAVEREFTGQIVGWQWWLYFCVDDVLKGENDTSFGSFYRRSRIDDADIRPVGGDDVMRR